MKISQGDNDSDIIKMENNGGNSQGADENPIDLLCENCDEYFLTLREFKKHKRLCVSEGEYIFYLSIYPYVHILFYYC